MHKYRAYFEKYIQKEIFNEEERNEVFGREEVLFEAMKLFIDHDMSMSANFEKPSIVYKDLSHPHFSLENPNLFYIEQENPKLMPRKGRFYLHDGHIEFVYENREFDALNGESHEYSGPEYLSWYSNDEIEEHLIFDSWTFEANLRHFLVYLLESFDDQIITDMEGFLSLSQKIVDNKIFKDAQVNYSGELMHEIAIELASNLDYEVSPVFRNPDFVKKLEETKDNFSGLISVINTALLYLVHVYNRLSNNLEHDVNIIKTGREGEEKVISKVEKTFHFAIKEGYTIAYDEDSFESDIILINETGVHLIEVKNYGSMSQQHQSFEISQDGEMTFYINGRETNARRSPVKQVQRHQALMKKILQDHGHDVPIKAYVVMANDYLSFVNHSDVPVLSLYQVESHLQKGRDSVSLEEANRSVKSSIRTNAQRKNFRFSITAKFLTKFLRKLSLQHPSLSKMKCMTIST